MLARFTMLLATVVLLVLGGLLVPSSGTATTESRAPSIAEARAPTAPAVSLAAWRPDAPDRAVRDAAIATSLGAKQVASGGYHTCALTADGAVKCWGSNNWRQVGDGTTTDRYTPTAVSGLSSDVIAISAGGRYTCALTSGGAVKCWGWNDVGQLGDGTRTEYRSPITVSGLDYGVVAIATGNEHACAITSSGTVKCWGWYIFVPSDGTEYPNWRPPTIVSGFSSDVIALAAGNGHTCALTSAGAVECWGGNSSGELGDGTTTSRYTPAPVSGLSSGVTAIAAGVGDTCAVTSAGAVMCWGWNGYGKLGDGTTTNRYTPTTVSGLTSGIVAVATRAYHTCALTSTGSVECWGWNRSGELGDGTTVDHNTPAPVSGFLSRVNAISAGLESTCALTATGDIKCWGFNGYGELGDSTRTRRNTPIDVLGFGGLWGTFLPLVFSGE